MSALLYFASALACLYLSHRITRLSRATALVLILLPLIFTGRSLFTGGIYGPVDLAYTMEPLASMGRTVGITHVTNPSISDVYTEFMPWNDALRRALRRGEWPLWNPYELCGTPLAGAAQAAPYHPVTVAGLLIPLRQYFGYAAAMLYLFAAISAFLLVKELTDSDAGALLAAAGWMASTHIVFFAGTALANAIAIAPLILLGGQRVVRIPGRQSAMLLTVALLLLVLSGHPESALHVVAFGVAYVVFQVAIAWPVSMLRVLLAGLGAGLAALTLSAVFLLPHVEAIVQSEEYVHRTLGYRQTSSSPAQMLHRLRANFFPFLEGAPGVEEPEHPPDVRHGWLATAYAGTMLLPPVIYGLWRARSRERWFFAAAIIVGLAAGVGAPGITEALNHIPGFALAINDRMIAFAAVGIVVLAGMGVAEWVREPRRALMWTFAIVAVLVILAAVVLESGVSADYRRVNASRAVMPLILAAAAVASMRPEKAALAIVALLLLQRATEAAALQPTLPARAFYPEFPGLSLMRADQPFRVVGVGNILPPAVSTHYGLEDVRGFQAVTFARYDSTYGLWCKKQPVWSNRVDDLSAPFLSLMNVRFAVAPRETAIPPGWILRRDFDGYRILENTRALPRAFVPRRVHGVRADRTSWLVIVALTTDFGERSAIEADLAPGDQPNGPGTVTVEGRGGRLRLRAHMEGAGWIVVSNAAWKGWRARVDGEAAEIRFANHAFIGIHLPRGEHEVSLIYRPRSFVLGAAVSALSALMTFFMSFQTSFFAAGFRRR